MSLGYWEVTLWVVVPATLWASWIDYKERRVPNWLNAALALTGVAMQYAYFGTSGLQAAFWGMVVGLAVLIVPWLMHGMGAGDVKLMAAIGAWFGPLLTLQSFALGALIGGVIGVVLIVRGGMVGHALINATTIATKMRSYRTMFSEYGSARSFGDTSILLPYGIPLTIGSLGILVNQYFGWWG